MIQNLDNNSYILQMVCSLDIGTTFDGFLMGINIALKNLAFAFLLLFFPFLVHFPVNEKIKQVLDISSEIMKEI